MKLPGSIGGKPSSKKMSTSAFCLIAILSIILAACGKKAEEAPREIVRPVKTTTVSAAADISGLTLPGTVRASQRVELAFKEVGGRLIELPIQGREGQEVKKGELLARIAAQLGLGYLSQPIHKLSGQLVPSGPQPIQRRDLQIEAAPEELLASAVHLAPDLPFDFLARFASSFDSITATMSANAVWGA